MKPTQLFAGDGADAEFFGLLQGAYKTGVKTANTVIKGLSQTK